MKMLAAGILTLNLAAFAAPPEGIDEILSYSTESLTALSVERLEANQLLNSIDLSNEDKERNELVVRRLKDIGEVVKAKVIELHFAGKTELDFSEKPFTREEGEIFSKLDPKNPTFKHVNDELKMLLAEKIREKTLEEMNKEVEAHPNSFHLLGGSRFSRFPRPLPEVHLYAMGYAKTFKDGERSYGQSELRSNINNILQAEASLIKKTSATSKQLKAPRFNGSYGYSISNCDGNQWSINNADDFNYGYEGSCDPGGYSGNGHGSAAAIVESTNIGSVIFEDVSAPFGLHDPAKGPVEPLLSVDNINIQIGGKVAATGGYSCGWGKTNCGDHTTTSFVNIQGSLDIPKCEDLYRCMPVREISLWGETQNLSFPQNKYGTGPILLTRDLSYPIRYSLSTSHSGKSGRNGGQTFANISASAPFSRITDGVLKNSKLFAAMKYLKHDISFLNSVAILLQEEKAKSDKNVSNIEKETQVLYAALSFIVNEDYEHNEHSKIAFKMIENAVKNRLMQVRHATLQRDVEDAVRNFESSSEYSRRMISVLNTLAAAQADLGADHQALIEVIEELTGQTFKQSSLNGFSVQKIVDSITFMEKNKFFKLRKDLEEKINELKLYGDAAQYEGAVF